MAKYYELKIRRARWGHLMRIPESPVALPMTSSGDSLRDYIDATCRVFYTDELHK